MTPNDQFARLPRIRTVRVLTYAIGRIEQYGKVTLGLDGTKGEILHQDTEEAGETECLDGRRDRF